MKKNLFILIITLVYSIINVSAQIDSLIIDPQLDRGSIGLGGGLDYGGFGVNVLVYPQSNIGLFAGAGYPLVGFGYNVGAKIRVASEQKFYKVMPYFMGMYGYNAVVKVSNATQYNKMFYGFSFGFGLDVKGWPGKSGYWTFALLIPKRSSEVKEYIDDLRNNHGVDFKNDLYPVGISIGYRFIIRAN